MHRKLGSVSCVLEASLNLRQGGVFRWGRLPVVGWDAESAVDKFRLSVSARDRDGKASYLYFVCGNLFGSSVEILFIFEWVRIYFYVLHVGYGAYLKALDHLGAYDRIAGAPSLGRPMTFVLHRRRFIATADTARERCYCRVCRQTAWYSLAVLL